MTDKNNTTDINVGIDINAPTDINVATDINGDPDINASVKFVVNTYTIVLENVSQYTQTSVFERFIQLGILCVSLVAVFFHVAFGLSMDTTIFLLILYIVFLLGIVYLKYRYIQKLI
jgi:hypothetical protein